MRGTTGLGACKLKVIRPVALAPPCRKGSREVALTDQQAEGTCHDGLLPSQRPCGVTMTLRQ